MKRLLILCLLAASTASGITAFGQSQDDRHRQRRLEREEKTKAYCMFMDSLIRSNEYVFRPYSMQLQPAGRNQQILNTNFRMDVRRDYIDLYLPFVTGITPPYRTVILNYTLTNIPEYRAEQSSDGEEWTITFSSNLYGADTYKFKMTVTTCTGDTMLEIRSPTNNLVQYSGTLSKIY